MNALANDEVGKYLNDRFVSSFQKVGTFRVVNGQKQGGNVASYFCLSDGTVLHALAGPVDAATLLRESRWVVETRKLAMTESRGDYRKYKARFQQAHIDRLRDEFGVDFAATQPAHASTPTDWLGPTAGVGKPRAAGKVRPLPVRKGALTKQAQVHQLLAAHPLAKIEDIYRVVFERILGETVSTSPVIEK